MDEKTDDGGLTVAQPGIPELQPHLQRVLAEREELHGRLDRLTQFAESNEWTPLPIEEKRRLKRQHSLMRLYYDVLDERIEAATTSRVPR